MKTNYNNLTFFEMCAVFAVVVGVGLICFEIYTALPQNEKAQVSGAFVMFDMHEDFAQSAIGFQSMAFFMQNYYDQFDLAFTQTFSFPDEIGTPVLKFASALDSYSQSVTYAYQQNNVGNSANVGQVLGAMFVKETHSVLVSDPTPSPQHFHKQYYYHEPTMVQKLLK
jgi:hypothetical protein